MPRQNQFTRLITPSTYRYCTELMAFRDKTGQEPQLWLRALPPKKGPEQMMIVYRDFLKRARPDGSETKEYEVKIPIALGASVEEKIAEAKRWCRFEGVEYKIHLKDPVPISEQ